jgi:hypothetical protein
VLHRAHPRAQNENTILCHRREQFPVDVDDAGSAAAAADRWQRLGGDRDLQPARAAVALLLRWRTVSGAEVVDGEVLFLPSGSGAPVARVLGRHSSCDSAPLPGAALRHALLLAWPAADHEAPRVEVLDLKTDVGLGVRAGAADHLDGMGPLRFGVGAADVVVVPVAAGVALPADLPALLRRIDAAPVPVRRARADARPGDSLEAALRWHAALEAAAVARDDDNDDDNDDHSGDGDGAVAGRDRRRPPDGQTIVTSVRAAAMVASLPPDARPLIVRASIAALETGVLLGRYERCLGHGDVADDGRVSRVHACLLVRRGRVFVVDAGSTHGTTVRGPQGPARSLGPRSRAARLADGDELWLDQRRCVVAVVDA